MYRFRFFEKKFTKTKNWSRIFLRDLKITNAPPLQEFGCPSPGGRR